MICWCLSNLRQVEGDEVHCQCCHVVMRHIHLNSTPTSAMYHVLPSLQCYSQPCPSRLLRHQSLFGQACLMTSRDGHHFVWLAKKIKSQPICQHKFARFLCQKSHSHQWTLISLAHCHPAMVTSTFCQPWTELPTGPKLFSIANITRSTLV